jgi:hypothetical protein
MHLRREFVRTIKRGVLGSDDPDRGGGRRAVDQFCDHYHRERTHQGLENKIIKPEFGSTEEGEVNYRERFGGLLRYYYRDAA